ncbi:LLM class flavin-dependent oxidoreductase [Aquibacillus kalidii]|uniref:LLM class flavin-dependent oxidoreductase n=1 Tax=Aquibacillus kalidii TaxID=2762597 RepID=UPI001647A4F0|nr:LLM class flavin-dependent oxidoreductase [Aquibacillus kalidii]
MVRLSILDQTVIPEGSTAQVEIENTTRLAQIAERLGYHRFWMAEHHLETSGHSSPEILIPHVASKTTTIRVGSGGVMLPNYSAYKVAENFRLLEALYPGRIDLGVGRAPGGIPLATMALQENRDEMVDRFPQQMDDLIHYLTGSKKQSHRFKGLKAMPDINTCPELWVLGSSGGSAGLAAKKGVSYAFAQFISGQHGGNIVASYHDSYSSSEIQTQPNAMVGFFVVCASTDREAEQLAASLDVHFLQISKGEKTGGIQPPAQAIKYPFSNKDYQIIMENRKKVLVGSPKTIKQQIEKLSKEYQAEEFILTSMIYDFHAKVKGYQLLAREFELIK